MTLQLLVERGVPHDIVRTEIADKTTNGTNLGQIWDIFRSTVASGMVGLAPKCVRLAKWEKFGAFSDQITLKSDLKKPRIFPIWPI